MSNLKVNSITNISNKRLLDNTGNIVQTVYVRSDNRSGWSSNNRYQFTPITDLTLEITPRSPDNIIIVQCKLFAEIHHDNLMTILADYGGGRLPYGAVEGYSMANFNPRYIGMIPADYTGADNSSTPRDFFMQGVWRANGTSTIRFMPGCKGSGGSDYTLYLNRTQSSSGQDSFEAGISVMIAFEVSQI